MVQTLSMKFSDYSDVKCNQTNKVKTPELEKFLEVPWELPKLRKKIAHRKNMKTLVNIQGSDSGISMTTTTAEDDSESEKYSSYPRRSVNANNEFHFQPCPAGNH